MPAMLDPKSVSKQEEFVEKQIETARRRIRTLDWFSTGLSLAIGSLALLFAVLMLDRYVETPAGTGWAVLALFVLGIGSFVYWSLYRPSRRQINPFYAAHQVEQTIPDAKNSVVNYVDLKDDVNVPGSVKTAIGVRAAKDLKAVDLNQVIQKRQIVWLAGLAGVFLVASIVAAALPPTRTTLAMLLPKEGNATITQGTDLHIELEVKGRVPAKTDADAPRARIWYNPDDESAYEDRPLEGIEDRKGVFGLTIPARQMRNGFRYQILAGNAASDKFEIKINIVPQFNGWLVEYDYPAYLNREPAKTDNQNLVGYYGTTATVTAFTNRPVKSGAITIDGQLEPVIGQVVEDNPEAIRFRFPMLKTTNYRVRFVTTGGIPNPEPLPKYRIALLDPVPTFLNFDVTYDYPKYLRAERVTVPIRQPHLEAMRGTRVTLVGHANRPIKSALIDFPGVGLIEGVLDPKQPTQATFALPILMQDGDYRISFQPKTDEGPGKAEVYKIRILTDEKPKVEITRPNQEVEAPANGFVAVEGIATDDIGLDKLNLRMQVISPMPVVPLAPKPYRGGLSFRREADNSYPTRLEYKDVIDLAKLKPEGVAGAGFQIREGMVIEYWLEAIDNCDVPPGPNQGLSQKQTIKVLPPETAEDKKKKQQQQQQQAEQDRKNHEQKQDKQNADEKRDPNQPQPQGDPQQQGNPEQQKKDGNQPAPKNGKPQPGAKDQPGNMGDPAPMDDPNLQNDLAKVEQALGKNDKNEPKGKPPEDKADPKQNDVAKNNPKDQPTGKDGTGNEPAPMPMEEAKPESLQKPEDFEKLAEKLNSDDKKDRDEAREQLKQMMDQSKKNPGKPEDQQKKLDDHRKGLDQDDKRKFDEAMKDIQKEMQNLQREEQVKNDREDRVKKAADKAMSNDPKKQEEGQKELERELQNQNARDDVDRQLQNLASGESDPEKKKKLEDAHNLSRDNAKKQQDPGTGGDPPQPKKEEEDVDRLAKKMQKGTDQEKQDAEDKLKKKLEDPKQRDQVQKQLDDIRQNLKDDQAKQNFDKSMDKVKNGMAKKDGKQPDKGTASDDIQKFAEKLTSDNKSERDEAQKQLEDAMKQADKDPQAKQNARKQLDQVRDNIKDPAKKEQFDKAMEQVGKAVDEQRKQDQAKADQQRQDEAKQLAKDLTSSNQAKKEAAEEKLEQALKDPAKKEQLKKDLNDAAGKDADKQQALKDAVQKAEEKNQQQAADAEQKKNEARQLARDLGDKDAGKQAAAQEKLEKMLQDPKQSDQTRKNLEDFKKDNPGSEQAIDDALKQADQKSAKGDPKSTSKDGKLPTPEDIEKLAKMLDSDDPATRDAVKKKIEQEMKKLDDNPKQRDDAQKKLEQVRDSIKDEKKRDEFDKNIKDIARNLEKARDEVVKDRAAQAAKDLQSKDPAKQQAARQELEKMMKDPAKQQALQQAIDEAKKNANPAGQQAIDDGMKQAGQNNAKAEKKEADTKTAERKLKEEVNKLAEKLDKGMPDDKQQAREQLKNLMQKKSDRPAVDKELDDFTQEIKDEKARREFAKEIKKLADELAKKDSDPKMPGKEVDLTKNDGKKSGEQPDREATPGSLPDLKNKVKAGELVLEEFKKKMDNEEFRKSLDWSPERMAEFQQKMQKQLDAMRKQIDLAEKGDLPEPRLTGPSILDKAGPERVNIDGKDNGPTNAGGKFIAPPGFGDPYGKFTDEVSGRRPASKK